MEKRAGHFAGLHRRPIARHSDNEAAASICWISNKNSNNNSRGTDRPKGVGEEQTKRGSEGKE